MVVMMSAVFNKKELCDVINKTCFFAFPSSIIIHTSAFTPVESKLFFAFQFNHHSYVSIHPP
jgi:hypothetical protein